MVSKGVKIVIAAGAIVAVGVGAILLQSYAAPPTVKLTIIATPSSGNPPLAVTFTGAYTDAITVAGIPNATVYLFVAGTNVGQGQTDANGNFSISYTFTTIGNFQCFVSDNTTGT